MKIITPVLALAFAVLVSVSTNAQSSTSGSQTKQAMQVKTSSSKAYLHNYNVPSSGLALEGYCPVAYFAVNKPLKGKREFASMHNGIWYFLVSADAKAAFEKEPEKYLPAYGGWCALGMAIEDKFPVDPTNFKIVGGRLMLFLKNQDIDAFALWNKDSESALVSKADAHWAKINNK